MVRNTIMKVAQLSPEEIVEELKQTQWARDFNHEHLLPLAKKMKAYELDAGSVIFEEGDHEKYMAVISKGRVEITKTSSRKENSIIAILSPGQSLGEMCLVDGQPRSAKATAKTNTILLVLDQIDLEELQSKNPEIAVKIIWKLAQMLSQRLRKTSGQLIECLG